MKKAPIVKIREQEKNGKETENFFSEGTIPHILDNIMADYCRENKSGVASGIPSGCTEADCDFCF